MYVPRSNWFRRVRAHTRAHVYTRARARQALYYRRVPRERRISLIKEGTTNGGRLRFLSCDLLRRKSAEINRNVDTVWSNQCFNYGRDIVRKHDKYRRYKYWGHNELHLHVKLGTYISLSLPPAPSLFLLLSTDARVSRDRWNGGFWNAIRRQWIRIISANPRIMWKMYIRRSDNTSFFSFISRCAE